MKVFRQHLKGKYDNTTTSKANYHVCKTYEYCPINWFWAKEIYTTNIVGDYNFNEKYGVKCSWTFDDIKQRCIGFHLWNNLGGQYANGHIHSIHEGSIFSKLCDFLKVRI